MKRNIYMQVLLFSVNGLYVMITDKQMKMMFGTDLYLEKREQHLKLLKIYDIQKCIDGIEKIYK